MKTSFGMEINDNRWKNRWLHLHNNKARIELVEMIIKLEKENEELKNDTDNT